MNRLISNVLAGMGSVLVLMPSNSPQQLQKDRYLTRSDAEAIHSDWEKVGEDMRNAAMSSDVKAQ